MLVRINSDQKCVEDEDSWHCSASGSGLRTSGLGLGNGRRFILCDSCRVNRFCDPNSLKPPSPATFLFHQNTVLWTAQLQRWLSVHRCELYSDVLPSPIRRLTTSLVQNKHGNHPRDDAGFEKDTVRRSTSPHGRTGPLHILQCPHLGHLPLPTTTNQQEERCAWRFNTRACEKGLADDLTCGRPYHAQIRRACADGQRRRTEACDHDYPGV
jgi:hypothetical protein